MPTPRETMIAQVEQAAADMDEAYRQGSSNFFDFLADDVVVVSNQSAEPIRGKESYRAFFENNLRGSQRDLQVLSRETDIVGETAIQIQTLQVTQNNVVVHLKQARVASLTENGWKVNHLHSSIIGSPQSLTLADNAEGVRVINERIASIAAVLGVAQ